MKILFANNFYPFFEQIKANMLTGHYPVGGTETSLRTIRQILDKMGNETRFFSMRHPNKLPGLPEDEFVPFTDFNKNTGLIDMIAKSGRILYSLKARKGMSRIIKAFHPDIVHLHTVWHQLSPSVIHEIRGKGIPIVMTLHNFKIVCANYQLRRGKKICEECRHGKYWKGFRYRCVKKSRLKSMLCMIEMYLHNTLLRTFSNIDVFIAPSRFLKEKILEMGFKGNIEHLPNPIPLHELKNYKQKHQTTGPFNEGKPSVCYCGRLSYEKGLHTLLDAAKLLKGIKVNLIGEGPMRNELENRVKNEGIGNITFYGFLSGNTLYDEMSKNKCIVIPSECYENNPLSVIESFYLGLPAVGARIGGIPELVEDSKSGYTFTPHDPADCARSIRRIISDPAKSRSMGEWAQRQVLMKNDPQKYCVKLLDLYKRVCKKK